MKPILQFNLAEWFYVCLVMFLLAGTASMISVIILGRHAQRIIWAEELAKIEMTPVEAYQWQKISCYMVTGTYPGNSTKRILQVLHLNVKYSLVKWDHRPAQIMAQQVIAIAGKDNGAITLEQTKQIKKQFLANSMIFTEKL